MNIYSRHRVEEKRGRTFLLFNKVQRRNHKEVIFSKYINELFNMKVCDNPDDNSSLMVIAGTQFRIRFSEGNTHGGTYKLEHISIEPQPERGLNARVNPELSKKWSDLNIKLSVKRSKQVNVTNLRNRLIDVAKAGTKLDRSYKIAKKKKQLDRIAEAGKLVKEVGFPMKALETMSGRNFSSTTFDVNIMENETPRIDYQCHITKLNKNLKVDPLYCINYQQSGREGTNKISLSGIKSKDIKASLEMIKQQVTLTDLS